MTATRHTRRGTPRVWLAVALVLLAACAGETAGPPATLARSNVIVIVVDTLRADHLGLYGYERDTSPFLDELAQQAVVFEQALASSSFTRESVSALFTGGLPSMSGSIGWDAAPSDELGHVGELFSAAGYRTALLTNTLMLGHERYTSGFDRTEVLAEKKAHSGGSGRLTERGLEFVAEAPDAPFFLYLHYLDPHGPYEPPEEFHLRFADSVHPDPVGLYTELRPEVPRYVAEGFGPGDPRYEDQQVRYDAEIVDVDRSLRRLVEGLTELGVGDDTLIVLTADHGEEFLEHGFVEHAWTLYQESIHVPLLFWAPGKLAPARVEQPVSLVDVLPTLTRLVDLPDAGAPDGVALFDDAGVPTTAIRPVVSEVLIRHRNVVRSVVVGRWKYHQARRWMTPGQRSRMLHEHGERKMQEAVKSRPFDMWGPVVREELYDLETDPGETRDLSETEPDRLAQMRAILASYEQRVRAAAPRQQGGAQEHDEATLEAIKALGY